MTTSLHDLLLRKPGEVITMRSASEPGKTYEMLVLYDGRVVHYGEGCLGERFYGPGNCRHTKQWEGFTMSETTALVPSQPLTPVALSFNERQLDIIRDYFCKGASREEVGLFVNVCERSGLDPFFRQIYAIMRRSQVQGQWVNRMTIQVAIDGYRLIAERTGRYAGMDAVEYLTRDGEWTAYWLPEDEDDHPVMARTAVHVKDFAVAQPGVVRWDEYVQKDGNGKVTSMWQKMPALMLGKCAEALALRRAFPNELSAVFSREEKALGHGGYDPAGEVEAEEAEWKLVEDTLTAKTKDIGAPMDSGTMALLDQQHEEPQGEPAAGAEEGSPAASPSTRPFMTPSDWLDRIEKEQGRDAKVAAISVMTRIWGTAYITKLSDAERHDYADMLQSRALKTPHEHEPLATAAGFVVCRVCGDEMDEEEEPAGGS